VVAGAAGPTDAALLSHDTRGCEHAVQGSPERFLITARIVSGESGCSAKFRPNGVSASSIAETMQAAAGMVPPSPAPLTPIGLSGETHPLHVHDEPAVRARRWGVVPAAVPVSQAAPDTAATISVANSAQSTRHLGNDRRACVGYRTHPGRRASLQSRAAQARYSATGLLDTKIELHALRKRQIP
jgi:hypothetical protein